MRTKTNKSISWGWVIFWCILFFPVGIWLLCIRVAADTDNGNIKTNVPLYITAYILICLGIVSILTYIIFDNFVIVIIFGAPGAWLLFKASKINKARKRYYKYMALLRGRDGGYINALAQTVGVTYNVALNDLLKMKNLGYFPEAQITQEVIQLAGRATPQQAPQTNVTAPVREKMVVCKNCGANNKVIIGRTAECEYCGSPLA